MIKMRNESNDDEYDIKFKSKVQSRMLSEVDEMKRLDS